MSGLFQAGQKAGLTNVVQLRSKRAFSTFPIGAKRKNTLGIESTRSVSYHHFEWAFCVQNAFFRLSPSGRNEKTPLGSKPRGRFHTTILSGLFQAGQKAGLTNVVQLRSKRVFPTFPIGAKRKNTPRIEYHEVAFMPPFRVGFSKRGKKQG